MHRQAWTVLPEHSDHPDLPPTVRAIQPPRVTDSDC